MKMTQLSIIIVNFKTPELTFRCIDSIYNSEIEFNFEIIVVDNFSQDHSKEYIISKFQDVIWIEAGYNSGFARANNLGVERASGEYILLLNSDMLLDRKYQIGACLRDMESNPEIGVLGCALLNEDLSYQKSTYYDVATIRYLLQYNIVWVKLFGVKSKILDAVMGSFMLLKRKDFLAVNGFDNDFFMYAEELDLCKRMKKKGQIVYFKKDFVAIHKHGGSSTSGNWSLRQNVLSSALLYFKQGGFLVYLLYHFIFNINVLTNTLLSFTLNGDQKRSYKELYKAYYYSFFQYFRIPIYYSLVKNRNFLKVKQ